MGHTPSRFAILLLVMLPACSLAGGVETPTEDIARERAFDAGARALVAADFPGAASRLATVAAICPVDPTGRRAMLMMAAAELDPRNSGGRPSVAAELAAFQLARPSASEAWIEPLAAELYVLALDYGADSIRTGAVPGALVLWSRYLEASAPVPSVPPVTSEAPLGASAGAGVADPTGEPLMPRAAVGAPASGGPLCDVPDADPDLVMPELTQTPMVVRAQAPAGERPAPIPTGSEDIRALMEENDRLRAELARKEQELDRIRRTLRP